MGDRWGTKRERQEVKRKKGLRFYSKTLEFTWPEKDKFLRCNIAELQNVLSFEIQKKTQKYPHFKNILVAYKKRD